MSLWSSRRGARLVAAVSVLMLAGCTSGTPVEPATSTPPVVVTPTATPTPTPTETAAIDVTVKPERPAALDEPPSVEGAVAVAEYFLLLFPYVHATGDLSDWNSLSHSECVYCGNVSARVEEKNGLGHHDQGGGSTITQAVGNEVEPGRWYLAKIDLLQEESATVDSAGQVVETFPGIARFHVDVAVVWGDGAWSIREATPTEISSP